MSRIHAHAARALRLAAVLLLATGCPHAPAPPRLLAATAAGPTRIDLTWKPGSGDRTGFLVERSGVSAAAGFVAVAIVGPDATSWSDTSVAPATTYWYRVRATSHHGDSGWAGPVSATTPAEQTTTITVTGRLLRVEPWFGSLGAESMAQHFGPLHPVPLADAQVWIVGLPPVRTDADGRFSISGAPVPYDLALRNESARKTSLFVGLTRADPTVVVEASAFEFPPTHQAVVSGHVTGAIQGGTYGAEIAAFAFSSPELQAQGGSSTWQRTPPAMTYFVEMGWDGPASTTGALRAIAVAQDADRLPESYAYGERRDLTVTGGDSLQDVDVAVTAIDSAPVSGRLGVPDGYTVERKTAQNVFPDGAVSRLLLDDWTPGASFSYRAPVLAGSAVTLFARAVRGTGEETEIRRLGIAPGSADLALTMPTAPALSPPAGGVTHVGAGTAFTWTPVPSAIHRLHFRRIDTSTFLEELEVFTTGASLLMPDFAEQGGFTLSPDTTLAWTVTAVGPFASMDEAAGAGTFYRPAAGESWLRARSAESSFTTGGPSLVGLDGTICSAGDAAQELEVLLTGASDTIEWTLSGPGSIDPTTGTATRYTPPATLSASTTATLTATAGALQHQFDIVILPGS